MQPLLAGRHCVDGKLAAIRLCATLFNLRRPAASMNRCATWVRWSGGGERLVKIGLQILDILKADGQPDAAIGNAHRRPVVSADAAVGG